MAGHVPVISIIEARARAILSRTLLIEIAGSSPAVTRMGAPISSEHAPAYADTRELRHGQRTPRQQATGHFLV